MRRKEYKRPSSKCNRRVLLFHAQTIVHLFVCAPFVTDDNNDQMRKSTYSFKRTSSSHEMEGTIDTKKRTILSRKNASEEKSKQQKEWQKRRRNRQRMTKSVNEVDFYGS